MSSTIFDTIICGDNCEEIGKLPDDSVDLIVTSPPYDGARDYGGFTFDIDRLLPQMKRVLKPGGVVVWVVWDETIDGSETMTSFKQAIKFFEAGFKVETMIYLKDGFRYPAHVRYNDVFEYMFVFSKGVAKTFNPLMDRTTNNANAFHRYRYRRLKNGEMERQDKPHHYNENGMRFNVWLYPTGYMRTTKDEIAYEHPAIFPDLLAEDHILSWSNKGDVVLDPFCGSGTTCKMAYIHGRKYIGIDSNPKFCEIARKRVSLNRDKARLESMRNIKKEVKGLRSYGKKD